MSLIVNLEEFSSLVGVTAETMKGHIRAIKETPDWLIERGDRGRGYKIEPRGGVEWWNRKREADEAMDAERRAQMAQLRLELVGDTDEATAPLSLSGRQRREEIEATFKLLELRKVKGELLEKAEVEHMLTNASVELRRRLQMVPGQFAIVAGMTPDQARPLDDLLRTAIDEFLTAIGTSDA